jgi:hypothetical protein
VGQAISRGARQRAAAATREKELLELVAEVRATSDDVQAAVRKFRTGGIDASAAMAAAARGRAIVARQMAITTSVNPASSHAKRITRRRSTAICTRNDTCNRFGERG